MKFDWSDEPEDTGLPTGWAIPLDESSDPNPNILPLTPPAPAENTSEGESFLLQGSDPVPNDEFHPRLRRFGEAA